ncbi:hypothetical protein HD553DRAFT_351328 [Filobasidium floriforme]|uniref:uncharacterized protein n=1 Tax=Filobasidium floriforme TaxID=5210 RepID=UPI001E8DE9A0|nr:uncharacterized protein HD553DRAFT_351328 [Filobasidium floriforme]KAH8081785.1 hypothetical protein HD553DRAFT_351328 [Filobasidium floriforme]
MSFRQDSDPGSVKSLLALLRSNQDANTSNTSNSVAGGSATATPPPAPPAANDPYSLASNPFHQATYGHPGSSKGTLNGHQHQHQPERAHVHGYDYGYQNQTQPGSAQTGGSSLQDLLATLRRNNSGPSTSGPSESTHRETRSHPSWIETLTGTERREREREEDPSQVQASGSKRRRIEREVDRVVEVEVDPYAEEDQHRPERGYEYDSYEANGTDDHDSERPARSPKSEHVIQVEDPHHSAVIDLSANPDNDNEVEEEEEDDRMNRYGYTPEQMSNLSIEEGKPIVDELIMRGDVVEKLKKLKKEQEELERHMWKKRGEIVADYKTKLPAERAPDHPEYKKIIQQRTAALAKFYAQRVLPFYDITIKKQLVALADIGFPCLGDPEASYQGDGDEGDKEIRKRREMVLGVIETVVGAEKGKV